MSNLSDIPKVRGGYDDVYPDFLVFNQVEYSHLGASSKMYHARPIWRCGWKTYCFKWSALYYGATMFAHHKIPFYIKDMSNGEIVHKSWEDEYPYHQL